MLKKIFILYLFLLPVIVSGNNLVGARFPALSPDGNQIAFSYLGDIWTVSTNGGKALRLTDHEAYDQRPVWSPDGKQLAFTSDRSGNTDVYLISWRGGDVVRLTYHSGSDVATGWTPDGKWVVFQSSRTSSSSIFKIKAEGGNAVALFDTYWSWPYDAVIDPTGRHLLFTTGMENRFHWRKGYQGANSSKVWSLPLDGGKAVEIVSNSSNSFWPQWSKDGQKIYFVSDRDGKNYNIWSVNFDGTELEQVSNFRKGDVRYLSLAANAETAVFEYNFTIWLTDLKTGETCFVDIEAPAELKNNTDFFVKNGRVSEYDVSPDGKKIAAVVRGDIFILSEKGGYARNITETPERESNVIWDKDSKNIIYVSDRGANPDLYRRSALGTSDVKKLTNTEADILSPARSPDGNWIAYCRGPNEIRLIKPDGKGDKLLVNGNFGGRFGDGAIWSPDSRYLAVVEVVNGQRDIFAIDIKDGKRIALTNTAYDETNPVWSPNGKFLLFSSNRSGHSFPEMTGKWDIYQVLFQPEKPEFKEDDFEKLFAVKLKKDKDEKKKTAKKAGGKKKKNIKVIFQLDNLDLQTKRVTNTLGNDRSFAISLKDTNTIYFVTNVDGKSHFWKTGLKKDERGKFSPFVPGLMYPRSLQMGPVGKYLYYIKNGKLGRIKLAAKKSESISFSSSIKVNKTADYKQALGEFYYILEHYYYDKGHHNANWKQLYKSYLPVLEQVRCPEDFYHYANELIGHLNSSHTGIRAPFNGRRTENPSRHVGVTWQIGTEVKIGRIFKDGPIWLYRDSVHVGDRLLRINGKEVDASVNLAKQLNGKIKKRLCLTFASSKSGHEVTLKLKAISARAETNLIKEEWIQANRQAVQKATSDQVAYIYMSAMGYGDLERFLRELERDAVPRKGLILDLRYNMGGNVHDLVINALMKPVYGTWKIRGMKESNQSTFGFADKPVILLVNEVTLSDGEMMSSGFKALKRGTIVGNTTYGWIIFTTSAGLMNGGSFRLPFWGCYAPNGSDLETQGGVTPDIKVINTINDDINGKDPQLERAIREILGQLKS